MVNKRLTGGVNGLRPLCSVRGSPDWGGAQPEVKWLAAPSSPITSNCPASSRAMASTDSNGEAARFHRRTGVGFTTSLLRKRGWLERIAGSNVASPGKGSRHGKFSSFRTVEQRLHAGGQRHSAAAAIAGHALMFRGNPTRHHKGATDIARRSLK